MFRPSGPDHVLATTATTGNVGGGDGGDGGDCDDVDINHVVGLVGGWLHVPTPLVSHNLDKWHCSENKKEKNKGTFPQTSRVFCQMRW